MLHKHPQKDPLFPLPFVLAFLALTSFPLSPPTTYTQFPNPISPSSSSLTLTLSSSSTLLLPSSSSLTSLSLFRIASCLSLTPLGRSLLAAACRADNRFPLGDRISDNSEPLGERIWFVVSTRSKHSL